MPLIKQARLHQTPQVAPGKQYLTFTLDKDEYAIDILTIQEIKGSRTSLPVTKIADAPAHIKGIMYLHNKIIPVVDLRIFYHLKPADHQDYKVIIIVNINQQLLGIVVDSVKDIIELTTENIKPAPEFFDLINHNYVQGVGTLNENLVIILDIEKLIVNEDLQIMQHLKLAGTNR